MCIRDSPIAILDQAILFESILSAIRPLDGVEVKPTVMSLLDDFPPDSCRCADTLIDPPTDNDSPVAATEVDTDSIPETVIEIYSDSSISDLPNPTANAPAPGTVVSAFVPVFVPVFGRESTLLESPDEF